MHSERSAIPKLQLIDLLRDVATVDLLLRRFEQELQCLQDMQGIGDAATLTSDLMSTKITRGALSS